MFLDVGAPTVLGSRGWNTRPGLDGSQFVQSLGFPPRPRRGYIRVVLSGGEEHHLVMAAGSNMCHTCRPRVSFERGIGAQQMKLSQAIGRIDAVHSRLDRRRHDDDEVDELISLALRRLITEPFEVLSKGLNPSRFDSWSKGARSRVARQFGSSSDLVLEVLKRAVTPSRGDLSSLLADAGDVIAAGESYTDTAYAFGRAFYENLASDDGFRIQVLAWAASPNRTALGEDLSVLYDSIEARISGGIEAILLASGRRARDGLSVTEQAGMLLAVIEGSVMQGQVRADVDMTERFATYVAFLLEHGSEPIGD